MNYIKWEKDNCNRIIYGSILLIVLGTLLQSYISFVNIMLVGICIVFTAYKIVYEFVDKKTCFVFMLSTLCCVICFALGKQKGYETSPRKIIYFFYFTVLYYNVVVKRIDFLRFIKDNSLFISRIIIIWNCIVGITVFIPGCYATPNNWGDYKYFFSIIKEGGARLGSDALMIMVAVLLQVAVNKKKKYMFLLVVPLYTIIMSGSRTYLVVGCAEFLLLIFFYVNSKRKFILLALPCIICVIGIAMLTSLGAKMRSVTWNENSIHNKYDTFSNGRFSPVIKGTRAFVSEDGARKLFGNGYGFIEEELNDWVFNDFIEISLIYGGMGLAVYLYCIYCTFSLLKGSKLPWYIKMAELCMWLFSAFFGLYYRMPALTISLIVTIVVSSNWRQENMCRLEIN